MAKVKTKKKSKTNDNPNVLGLTDDDFIIDKKNKSVSAKDGVYEKYRPDELTDKLESMMDKYRGDFSISVASAGFNKGSDEFSEDDFYSEGAMFGQGTTRTDYRRKKSGYDCGISIVSNLSDLNKTSRWATLVKDLSKVK